VPAWDSADELSRLKFGPATAEDQDVNGEPTAPLLGRMLVERGLITEGELDQALERSRATGSTLGVAVLELDLVPPTQVADLLAAQRSWRPLGWMLTDRHLLTEAQLADCLEEAAETGRRLGEVVRARGLVPHGVLENLLAEQYQLEVELERGFGAGLRGEIERRYRLKRAPGDDDEEPSGTASSEPGRGREGLVALSGSDPPAGVRSLQPAIEQRERSLDALDATVRRQAAEIERLQHELSERDATILDLRDRLSGASNLAEPARVHRLHPA
jgi:N-acetylglucosaminyldiphosphoundecaprenol N-acetyl-beta-D-mannosaminyltransferase